MDVVTALDQTVANMQRIATTIEENTNNTSMMAAAVEEMAATIHEIA